jgi:hypothetical protein
MDSVLNADRGDYMINRLIYRFFKKKHWKEFCIMNGKMCMNDSDNHQWRNCNHDDIEAIRLEAAKHGWTEVTQQSTVNVNIDINSSKINRCDHEFVEYTGFIEQFTYCRKCDVKK